ncbi:MAG: alanyl-tRNA editing protein [Acidobacteriota bacterium]|jgi:misacylated tRNA(Ala) deacylase
MTELLFHTDAYLREFEATVTATDSSRSAIVLDRTAFYAGGGGQPCDTGEIYAGGKSLDVVKVKKEDDDVVHLLAAGSTLPEEGEKVSGALDWERRYALMRTHTAMHILCGVVWRDYQAQVTGGNMEPLEGRMDFEFERMERELVEEIEAKINEEVEAARDVVVRTLPRAEAKQIPDLIRTKINLVPAAITEIRTVEIVGLDLQADGGTHVANTREVGRLRIIDYKSKGRINKRIRVGLEES